MEVKPEEILQVLIWCDRLYGSFLILFGISTYGGTYYAKYILGNDNIIALLGAVGLIPTFLGFILTGPMTSKLGMTKLVGSCVKGAVACVEYINAQGLQHGISGGVLAPIAKILYACLSGLIS